MTPEEIRALDYEDAEGFVHTQAQLQFLLLKEVAAQLAELNAHLKNVIDPREGTGWGAEVRVSTSSCGFEG